MATVTATINDALLGSWTGTLTFTPDRQIKVLSDRLVTGDVKEVAVSAGSMSTTLAQGAYWVEDKAGETIKFRIVVPAGSDSYELRSLISSGAAELPTITLGVTTFNTRTGDVIPAASDYDADQIDVAATPANYSPASADVEAHLAAIDAALPSAGSGQTLRLYPTVVAMNGAVGDAADNDVAVVPNHGLYYKTGGAYVQIF